jgi:hypothetical protein
VGEGDQVRGHQGRIGPRDSSARPGSIADPSACVWLVKCRVAVFDVVEIDRAERRQRLLQGRAGLNLDELILEITARKVGHDLGPLLRRIVIVSNPDDVHQDTRVGESNLGPHEQGDAGRRMQGDRFPHQICFRHPGCRGF